MKYLFCALFACCVPFVSFADEPKHLNLEGRIVTLTGKISEEIANKGVQSDAIDRVQGYLLTVKRDGFIAEYRLITKRNAEEKALHDLVGKEATIEGLDGRRSTKSFLYVIKIDESIPHKATEMFSAPVIDLNEKQQKIFDRIRKSKAAVACATYRLNNLYNNIEFAKKVDIRFKLNGVEVVIRDCVSDKGHVLFKEGTTNVVLTVQGSSATGLIYYGGRVYAVESLGDWVVVVTQVDQSKFPKD